MTNSRRALGLLSALSLSLGGACVDDGAGDRPAAASSVDSPVTPTCGPTVGEKEFDSTVVPDVFLIGESPRVTRVIESQQGFSAAILIQLGLDPALEQYRDLVKGAGYEVLNEDYEGFEAEIYMREGGDYVTLQLRETACDDQTVAYLRVIFEQSPAG